MFVKFTKLDPVTFKTTPVRVREADVKGMTLMERIQKPRFAASPTGRLTIDSFGGVANFDPPPETKYNVVRLEFYDGTSMLVAEAETKVLTKLANSGTKRERREAQHALDAEIKAQLVEPKANQVITLDGIPLPGFDDFMSKYGATGKTLDARTGEIVHEYPTFDLSSSLRQQDHARNGTELIERVATNMGARKIDTDTFLIEGNSPAELDRLLDKLLTEITQELSALERSTARDTGPKDERKAGMYGVGLGAGTTNVAPLKNEDPAVTTGFAKMARDPLSFFSRIGAGR